MDIGILTFHNAYNYGAVLQAYATQSFIKGLGHNVEVIDYHNPEIDAFYNRQKFRFSTLPKKRFFLIPKYCSGKYFYWKKRRSFELFKKRFLNLSDQRYVPSHDISFDQYDMVLVGSDQLWNPALTKGFDRVYWGDFKMGADGKRITWAICMNASSIDEGQLLFIQEHLKNFTRISVREDSLKILLDPCFDNNVVQLADPVFLLHRKEWESLCKPVKKKNFIVVYALKNQDETISAAKRIAEKDGKSIVIIHPFSDRFPHRGYEEKLGPIEFLSYIYAADGVVTSSFHGTAFSLILCKKFICIEPKGTNNIRIRSLLHLFKQEDHILPPEEAIVKGLAPAPLTQETDSMSASLQKEATAFFNSAIHPNE